MFPATLLTTVFLALAVAATPVHPVVPSTSLPLSRRLNTTSLQNLVAHDQARALTLLSAEGLLGGILGHLNGPFSSPDPLHNEPITNQAVQYTATITVGTGSSAAHFSLAVDTGSSNTWVGADPSHPYVKTISSSSTADKVAVSYGSGSFSGTEYIDTVTITPELVIRKQSIGVASKASGFDGIDGILGIGPVDLTLGTLSPSRESLIPTLTDNLFSQGSIRSNSIAISFEPTTVARTVNGQITWGATDSTRYTGPITYIPVTTTSPAKHYWGINQAVRYGTLEVILARTAGIVDTGTSLILLATDAFNKYTKVTGGVMDDNTGLLRITDAQYKNLSSLYFDVVGRSFELTPNAQIWPRSLNTAIGGTAKSIYLVVSDLGSQSGVGLDFILGYTFLERFYSVYDTAGKRVGLATTPHTSALTN